MKELLYQRVFEKTYGPFETMDGLLSFAEPLRVREPANSVQAEWDVPADIIGTNLFSGGAPAWSRCPYEMPAEVQAKIFRGDSGFLPKMFSVKQFSSFSSSKFPIVIVGKSPLSAGLVRKQVPLLHPAA